MGAVAAISLRSLTSPCAHEVIHLSLPGRPKAALETGIERVLFASRWLLVPFYLGMALALVAVMVVFLHEFWVQVRQIAEMDAEQVILLSLSLIDLSLTANLLLIVIFAGYENFVSRLDAADHEDRPRWMGSICCCYLYSYCHAEYRISRSKI